MLRKAAPGAFSLVLTVRGRVGGGTEPHPGAFSLVLTVRGSGEGQNRLLVQQEGLLSYFIPLVTLPETVMLTLSWLGSGLKPERGPSFNPNPIPPGLGDALLFGPGPAALRPLQPGPLQHACHQ